MAEVVLAAMSASLTRVPVLAFANLFARVCSGTTRALHVSESHGAAAVSEPAFDEHVDMQLVEGEPVLQITRAAESPSVKLVVVGAHSAPDGRGPGFVTRRLATRLRQPLLVVPPGTTAPDSLQRVVFALEGTAATTAPICALLEQFSFAATTDLIVLHSFAREDAPRLADHQPQEYEEWRRVVGPYLPPGFEGGVVLRAGPPEQTVPDEAAALGASLTVVSWSQVFAPGRALLVTKLLADLRHPILLVPARYGASPRLVDLRDDEDGSVAHPANATSSRWPPPVVAGERSGSEFRRAGRLSRLGPRRSSSGP